MIINTLKHTAYLQPIEANKENSQYPFSKIPQNRHYKYQAQILENIAKQKLHEISNFNTQKSIKKRSLEQCNPYYLNFQELSAWQQQNTHKKQPKSRIVNKKENKKPLTFKKREFRKFSYHNKNKLVTQENNRKIEQNNYINKLNQEINVTHNSGIFHIQDQDEIFLQEEDRIFSANLNNVFIDADQKQISRKNETKKSKRKDTETIKKRILDNLGREMIINRSMNSFFDQNIQILQQEINRSNSSFCNYNENMIRTCKNQAPFYKNNKIKIKKLVEEIKINPHSMVLKQKKNIYNIKKSNIIKHTKIKKSTNKSKADSFCYQNPILKQLYDKYDSILKKSKER